MLSLDHGQISQFPSSPYRVLSSQPYSVIKRHYAARFTSDFFRIGDFAAQACRVDRDVKAV